MFLTPSVFSMFDSNYPSVNTLVQFLRIKLTFAKSIVTFAVDSVSEIEMCFLSADDGVFTTTNSIVPHAVDSVSETEMCALFVDDGVFTRTYSIVSPAVDSVFVTE